MLRTFSLSIAAAAAVGVFAGTSSLAHARTSFVQAAAEVAPADLEGWVRDLDSDGFDERQEAARRMIAAGKQAIPYAVEAAQGDNAEVSSRAVAVLKQLSLTGDEPTQAVATEALKSLSKSDDKAVARRAAAALAEAFGEPDRLSRLNVHTGNKRIEIRKDAEGVKVAVTASVDGKKEASIYKATNVEELKKNHPEGYELYEKHFERAQRREIEKFWQRIESARLRKAAPKK